MRAVRVVAGALLRGGRVLAARRPAHKSQGGLWELPGGKVEPGESDEAALARELEEELGVRIAVRGRLGEALHRYPDREILLVGLHGVLLSGEPLAREHSELAWVDACGLHALDWAPADLPLLAALAARLRGAE